MTVPAPRRTAIMAMLVGTLFTGIGLLTGVGPLAAPASARDQAPPYWASISRPRAIMRRGPASEMRAMWEYRRVGLPLRVLAIRDEWRQVQDPDGITGWMHRRLLTGRHTAIVTGSAAAAMRVNPRGDAAVAWRAAPGVIGQLGECANGWCQFDVDGRTGWISTNAIWGD